MNVEVSGCRNEELVVKLQFDAENVSVEQTPLGVEIDLPGARQERIRCPTLAAGVTEVAVRMLYARDREWALTADDVLRRRTTLALTGRDSDAVRARVETLLAS